MELEWTLPPNPQVFWPLWSHLPLPFPCSLLLSLDGCLNVSSIMAAGMLPSQGWWTWSFSLSGVLSPHIHNRFAPSPPLGMCANVPVVMSCSYCNKLPQPLWLLNNRNSFSPSSAQQKSKIIRPKSRCQQVHTPFKGFGENYFLTISSFSWKLGLWLCHANLCLHGHIGPSSVYIISSLSLS